MLKRSVRKIAAPAVRLESLETRQLMAANAWKSAVSGNWNDASKWSLGHVPTKAEDAVISVSGSYTVTVGDGKTVYNPEINKLTLGGGSGAQNLTVLDRAGLYTRSTFNVATGDSVNLNGGILYSYAPTGTKATLDGTINVRGVYNDVADVNLGGSTYSGRGSIVTDNVGGGLYVINNSVRGYGAVLGSGITIRGDSASIYGGFTSNGKIIAEGGATDKFWIRQLTNNGTIDVTTGSDAEIEWLVNNAAGQVNLANGAVTKLGRTLTNSGTIVIDTPGRIAAIDDITNNGNLIGLGGTIRLGKFKQGSTGQLTVGLNATSAGQFEFAEAPTLGGTLNAVRVNGYTPAAGTQIVIGKLTKPALGTFATKNLDTGDGVAFDLTTTTTALTLTSKAGTNFAGRDTAGNLNVTGTTAADTITTKTAFALTSVTLNGKTSVFYDRQISTATINAGDGNDKITLSGPRGWTLRGGAGNDTLTGGSGADSLYGEAGRDTLYAKDGVKDLLDGGADTDVLASADSIDTKVSI